jgi:metallo-beta-lactamase family protein
VADAQAALGLLRPIVFGKRFSAGAGITAQFSPVGHILGAAMVQVTHEGTSVLFSGDLSRAADPIMLEPAQPPEAAPSWCRHSPSAEHSRSSITFTG